MIPATELPLEAVKPASSERVLHVVEAGQTLWRIAKVYGVALETLARVNGIDDAASLQIGQELWIPGARARLDVPPYPSPVTGLAPRTTGPAAARFDWPVRGGRVLSAYGAPRREHRHEGIDIEARAGEPVLAVASGRVVYSGSTLRGYGKTIVIDHGGGLQSLYAHNSALLSGEGDWVERGSVIARVGSTGNASTDHCHLEIRKDDTPVDPLLYLAPVEEASR